MDEWTPYEKGIERLAGYAQADADVEDVAAAFMLMLPESRRGQLSEMLANEELAAQMRARFPLLAPYPRWLDNFLYELRVRFGLVDPDAEPPDDAPDTPAGPLPSDGVSA